MSILTPAIEISTIEGVLSNFDWVITKQEITKTEITLTVTKPLKRPHIVTNPEKD